MKATVIIATLILFLSCGKKEPDIKVFEGNWYKNATSCPQASTPLKIEFVKVIGNKSKHRNEYKVVGGQGTFYCSSNDPNAYYHGEFTFESIHESSDLADATDGNLLTFKIEKMDVMRITCSCGWKLTLTRVK